MHMDGEGKRTTSEGARDGGIYAVFRWMLMNGLRLIVADFVIPNLATFFSHRSCNPAITRPYSASVLA